MERRKRRERQDKGEGRKGRGRGEVEAKGRLGSFSKTQIQKETEWKENETVRGSLATERPLAVSGSFR